MSNHTCSDRPLPTCKTSIVVTATIFTLFKANTKETTKEVARPKAAPPLLWWRPTAATFVVDMNRVDVVDLVVDLVDLDLDVDLVDVDLAVSLCDGPRSVLFSFGLVAPTCFICFRPRRELFFRGLVRQFRQYYFPAVFPAS